MKKYKFEVYLLLAHYFIAKNEAKDSEYGIWYK